MTQRMERLEQSDSRAQIKSPSAPMNIVSDFPKNAGVVDDDNDSAVDDNDFGYEAQAPGSPSKKMQVSNDSINTRNKNEKIKLVELFLKMRYPL